MAKRYINSQTQQVVIVGAAKKINPILEKFGTVVVFDADAKPQGTGK